MHDQPQSIQSEAAPQRLNPNPIPHLTEGVKNMVRTNLKPLFAAIAATISIPAVFAIAAVAAMTKYDNAQLLWGAIRNNVALLTALAIVVLIATACLELALNRVILLGARSEHTTIGESMRFSLGRLLPAIGTYAVIGMVMALPAGLIVILMSQLSPWLGVLFVPLIVAYIAASFFLTPLSLILIDSPPLGSLIAILKRLKALWKQGFLVLAVYILCMSFVGGGMGGMSNGLWSLPDGSNSSSSSQDTQPDTIRDTLEASGNQPSGLESISLDTARWIAAIGGIVLLYVIVISTTMQAFFSAGFAHVYDTVATRLRETTGNGQNAAQDNQLT